jgi:hypothetical protein
MEAIGLLQVTPAMRAAKIPLSQHLSNELTQAEIASPVTEVLVPPRRHFVACYAILIRIPAYVVSLCAIPDIVMQRH